VEGENRKVQGMEDVNEMTFPYGGCKFVWGGDNQEDEERQLLIRIITVTETTVKKGKK
jgi:hypothetical protein